MTDLIVSILYIIGLAVSVIMPITTARGIRNHLLDEEDEILHKLTACCED